MAVLPMLHTMGIRLRLRLLDLAVALTCVACVCAPLMPTSRAAESSDSSVIESGSTVDQVVSPGVTISDPLNSWFQGDVSGVANGAVGWEISSNAVKGAKLAVSATRTPAMRDPQNGVEIDDYAASPSGWSVSGDERRFGFSAVGSIALDRYGDGSKWRGFAGRRSIEVGRKGTLLPPTRTTVKLVAEYSSPLKSDARPGAVVEATVMGNL